MEQSNLTTDIIFNIAAINRSTTAEGPFNRLAIWFQGCNLNCKNCCNPDLQSFVPKNILSLEQILSEVNIAKKKYDIEGVTLTGGEPTLQQNLDILCEEIKQLNLGIILFTGQKAEKLPKKLLAQIDTVIDGPYIDRLPDNNRRFVGSTNQRIINLTGRYTNALFIINPNTPNQVVNIAVKDLIINGDVVIDKSILNKNE